MEKSSEIRTGRHCVFVLHVHLVFITKYRKNIFQKQHLQTLKEIFDKICKDFECKLKKFDGESDYVHLLIDYPPKVTVSKLVNSLKGVSSRKLRQIYPELKNIIGKMLYGVQVILLVLVVVLH